MKIDRALLSVSDKQGIVELARTLSRRGIRILSTGGTAATLRDHGIPVVPISEYTGFPEILDGRVKTLHPLIHGGILARPDDPEHLATMQQHSIKPIGLVVVNLYPFEQTIRKDGTQVREAIEQIDIGGPTMIRAAAKNAGYVTVVVDPSDYESLAEALRAADNQTSQTLRWELAQKAFAHTAAYDRAIAGYIKREVVTPGTGEESPPILPETLHLDLKKVSTLRYGENPHQNAALYNAGQARGLLRARQLQGKELSFNNYLDLDGCRSLTLEFSEPFCAITKHTNPCGAALGEDPVSAYRKALSCDPVSAFGSVIGFNTEVDALTAAEMKSLFVEGVIAPSFSAEALEIFESRKNLRLLQLEAQEDPPEWDFRAISGGFLVQQSDVFGAPLPELQVVSSRPPTERELADLQFAWLICKHVKSNAIVYASNGQTVGVGAGQMSRVDSVELAARKAVLPTAGSVLASDAFFPFRDGVDAAASAGATAAIQPGGSIRDAEVIEAANEHGMAMVFTGRRHFRH